MTPVTVKKQSSASSILAGVVADQRLTEQELLFLDVWLRSQESLGMTWPKVEGNYTFTQHKLKLFEVLPESAFWPQCILLICRCIRHLLITCRN